MKQILAFSTIFIGFALLMTGVKSLDRYSKDYRDCARQWQSEIDMAAENSYLTEHLIERLEKNQISIGGKSCPKLLYHDEIYVRKALEENL